VGFGDNLLNVTGSQLIIESHKELLSRKLQPEHWGKWADELDATIAVMAARGVVIAAQNRIRASSDLLRACEAARRLPQDAMDDGTVVHALRNAIDFSDIAKFLPGRLSKRDQGELAIMVNGGTLAETEGARQPYQYQSSLWFGAVLHYAGLEPKVPAVPLRRDVPPNPDYLVERFTMQYGIEVKRPMTWPGLERDLFPRALEQLEAWNVSGAVVVDISDLVAHVDYAHFNAEVISASERVVRLAWDDARKRVEAGCSRVMVVAAFARNAHRVNSEGTLMTIANAMFVATLAERPGTLKALRAKWLSEGINAGARKAQFVTEGRDLSFPHDPEPSLTQDSRPAI
jgi:hypothetical protein